MKRLTILFFAFFVVLVLHAETSGQTLAPDFTLVDIDGNTFSLSQFRGNIVLIDFFATYCGPCRNEIGQLRTVKNTFSNVIIISLSVWEKDTDTVLQQFRINHSISWILARDTKDVYDAYACSTIPTVCIIDYEGYIKSHHTGYTDDFVFIAEITLLLHGTSCVIGSSGVVT